MNYLKMLFKKQKVYVLVDTNGKPVAKNGRAVMKYSLTDNREYNPAVSNLEVIPNEQIVSGAKENLPKTSPATEPLKDSAINKTFKLSTSSSSRTITAFTDGGCIGNPGPAGLGYLIIFPDGSKTAKGEPLGKGTNNIAELTAILRVLELVDNKTAPLTISTDSSYSIGVLTKGWKAKVNQELIQNIKNELKKFKNVTLLKVKGHAGHPENELVDKLANGAARTQKIQTSK